MWGCIVEAEQLVIKLQWGRAFFHASFGVLALLFGQVLSITESEKIQAALCVGGGFTVLDIGVRLPIYYWLVHKKERRLRSSRIRNGIRSGFLWLEDRLLIRTGILRAHERGLPTTSVQFALGVLIPIWIGIPLWSVVPAVVIFGFGDPAARLMGMAFGTRTVWKDGMKTWVGFVGYCYAGTVIGLITVLLHKSFPLYPIHTSDFQLIIAVLVTAMVGAFFELLCEKDGALISQLFDDNFVVPFVGSVAFYAIATVGMT